MKFEYYVPERRDEGETIAYFGDAKLINQLDGKLELRGGSDEDQVAARKWISRFMHAGVDPTAKSQAAS